AGQRRPAAARDRPGTRPRRPPRPPPLTTAPAPPGWRARETIVGRRTAHRLLGGQAMYLIRERFFRLGEDSEVTDDQGRPVLHVDGKVLSLHDRLVLRDPSGNQVASVHRKLVALRPTYQVTIGGEEAAEVRKHLFTPFGDR